MGSSSIDTSTGRPRLLVDGRPFLLLGAQVHNSSAWPSPLEQVWPQLDQLGGNTLEAPIYWQDVEREEGIYDFGRVDSLLEGARAHGKRLVLLWFGTWKNGTLDYVPAWVKSDTERFPRMRDRWQREVRVLTPHAPSNLAADRRAFVALLRHLKEVDGDERTVIVVQVQNEPGSLFTVRDFAPAAQALFEAPVPEDARLAGESEGSWSETFGSDADELFAAYHVARYVEEIAVAGRAEYEIPLAVNVWLRERKSWGRPGEEYPSGGPTSNVLDLWKALTPSIDIIAPDIYVRDIGGYREVCEAYRRDDNPLVIPETYGGLASARHLFEAIGNYDAVGFAPFGFNRRDGELELDEDYLPLAASFDLLFKAESLLHGHRGRSMGPTRCLQAAVEESDVPQRLLHFDGWEALVQWGPVRASYGGEFPGGTRELSGRSLVVQSAADEFYVLGFDSKVTFRPSWGSEADAAEFLSVEEGFFDGERWIAERQLCGDQTFFGLSLRPWGTLLRVSLHRRPEPHRRGHGFA